MPKAKSHAKALPKRKRDETTQDLTQERLERKFFHYVKEVKQASKKAKTFDLQKQVKKLKSLREKGSSSEDIESAEAQLAALKTIDTNDIGCHALRTKLHKDRLLSNDDRVKAVSAPHFSSFSPAPPSDALGKVQSRLLSSKILASEVARLLNDLRVVLNPPCKEEQAEGTDDSDDETAPAPRPSHTKKSLAHQPVASDDEAGAGDEGDVWESGTVQESDGSSDEVSDDGGLEDEQGSSPAVSHSVQHESDLESTAPAPPKKARQEKKLGAAESTFLPSLAVGFVRGNSDSEWSDSEAKVADNERKNRRGQRARRAIWEKKYGKNAAHVKKQRELAAAEKNKPRGVKSLDQGWAQRGAQAQRARPGLAVRPARQTQMPARPSPSTSGTDRPSFRTQSIESKPLHPSWEAKRKQAEKASAGIAPSRGTKIKFTD